MVNFWNALTAIATLGLFVVAILDLTMRAKK